MADMGTKQAAEKWGVPQNKVAEWCRKGLIKGATQDKERTPWHIPKDATPPDKYKK